MFYKTILNLLGWNIKGVIKSKKGVIAVAPHTSYLDGVIGFLALKASGFNYTVLSAEWLFFWPFKYIMKYLLHAIPVGKNSGNAITISVNKFKSSSKMHLVICPEGQLKAIEKWNPGCWMIAKKANVPVEIVALNYKTKTIYFCGQIDCSEMGVKEFMGIMYSIYSKYGYPKYPENFIIPNKPK